MKHYPHHIGDFDRATRHLTRIERSIYRDLLDLYYDTETRLTLDIPALCRRIVARSNEESTAVEQVLSEFFTETPTGWYHVRCEEEIEAYQANTSQKAVAGKASAEAKRLKKLQALNGYSTENEQPLNSVPTATNGTSTNHQPSTNQPVINTPIPPTGAKTGQSAISLPTWLTTIKAMGEDPIPADDPVFGYADSVGIPRDHLRLAWREFRERYSLPNAKRYRCWRTVFRKAVRGNWFKLWHFAGDACALTTTGVQAKRAAEANAGVAA